MRIYQTKIFAKWAKKEKIAQQQLIDAANEINRGLVDAYLGGYVYKKRIARDGKGKRSGYRSILAFRANDKAFYIVGFSKNEQSNLTEHELVAVKKFAKEMMTYTESDIQNLLEHKELIEVEDHGKK